MYASTLRLVMAVAGLLALGTMAAPLETPVKWVGESCTIHKGSAKEAEKLKNEGNPVGERCEVDGKTRLICKSDGLGTSVWAVNDDPNKGKCPNTCALADKVKDGSYTITTPGGSWGPGSSSLVTAFWFEAVCV